LSIQIRIFHFIFVLILNWIHYFLFLKNKFLSVICFFDYFGSSAAILSLLAAIHAAAAFFIASASERN